MNGKPYADGDIRRKLLWMKWNVQNQLRGKLTYPVKRFFRRAITRTGIYDANLFKGYLIAIRLGFLVRWHRLAKAALQRRRANNHEHVWGVVDFARVEATCMTSDGFVFIVKCTQCPERRYWDCETGAVVEPNEVYWLGTCTSCGMETRAVGRFLQAGRCGCSAELKNIRRFPPMHGVRS